jgi:hypothetical protein
VNRRVPRMRIYSRRGRKERGRRFCTLEHDYRKKERKKLTWKKSVHCRERELINRLFEVINGAT